MEWPVRKKENIIIHDMHMDCFRTTRHFASMLFLWNVLLLRYTLCMIMMKI